MVHQVKKGQSLYGIARIYNVTVDDIVAANPNCYNNLKEGDDIIIPVNQQGSATTATTTAGTRTTGNAVFHTIQKGESMYSVAKQYNTTIENLLAINPGIYPNNFIEGDVIKIIPNTPTNITIQKDVKQMMSYVAAKNDTYESIAKANNVSVEELKAANPDMKKVKKGKTVYIPKECITTRTVNSSDATEKQLERTYANQLGARQGAGAVYLHAHHPDIYAFLDTKRENADEKIRIKTLSLGVVIPDITFELARKNEDMYLFSPYDVERVYGVPFSEISVTEKYHEMVDDGRIRKKKINARRFFQTIAEIQFESGYPYIVFEDTVNKANPIKGRITMSNLCSEILQVSEASTYNDDLSYAHVGKDISCNLGSLNIAKTMDSPDFSKSIEMAIRGLTAHSNLSDIGSFPSIARGNAMSQAIGLGQMNLHGYLAREHVHYGSEEALDFTNMYFMTVLFEAIKASCKIARERGETFEGFEESKYASGEFFRKYIDEEWAPTTDKCRELLAASSIKVPTQADWEALAADVAKYGMYNQNLQAVPPTGSISYINGSTSSIHPIASKIEIRKEGKLGRVYYPAPYMSNENLEYYQDAYEIGPEKIIDTYAVATQHVDQGLSLTLFYPDTVTTRDLNKSYIYAWKKGIKTLYYMRLRQMALEGTEVEGCVSCML